MTSQPPPPPGDFAPLPPSGVGYPPPPPAGFVQGPYDSRPGAAPSEYTSWLTRVFAYVIDTIPFYLLMAIGGISLVAFRKVGTVCTGETEFDVCLTGDNGPTMFAWIIVVVCVLAAVAFSLWNLVVRQGNTGSSIGKQMMKFKVVGDESQQPIGAGKSFVRQLAHGIDAALCYIGFLLPLFNAKRQTIADMLLKTVCVPI